MSGRSRLFEESCDSVREAIEFVGLGLAFPDDQYSPTEFPELSHYCLIAGCVPLQFRQPVFLATGRNPVAAFAAMLVPEAAMDKDNLAPPREYQVGFAGQILAMQSEAIAERVSESANNHFRLGVFRMD